MQENNTGFISHKELAQKFGVHPQTLKKELKRIAKAFPAELQLRPMQRLYSPAELKIIFKHLGNPYEKPD